MADRNSFSFDVAAWVGRAEWSVAAANRRHALLRRLSERGLWLKRHELAIGQGVDGRKLKPVKPESRPDGAKGAPLVPHYADSRSHRRLRASTGSKSGRLTFWWSHGWGRILGYHRAGIPGRLPVRDVIGLTPADEARLKSTARAFWRTGATAFDATPDRPARENARPRRGRGPVIDMVPAPGTPKHWRRGPLDVQVHAYVHADRMHLEPVGGGVPGLGTGFRQRRRAR